MRKDKVKRVLIIGPNFHYFNASIERAFRCLGLETKVEAYDTPIHPYFVWNKIRYKVSKEKLTLKQESRQKYDAYIRARFDTYRPDLVFIMNGDNLTTSSVAYFHKKAKVVFWLFDSIIRMMYSIDNLREADAVYCYEQKDIPLLAKEHIAASFLPQAVDTTLYYPIRGIEKKYDIVFAGEVWNSKKRQHLLQSVVRHFSDKKIRIVGRCKLPTKDFLGWLFRKDRDIYTNKISSAEELNLLYNQARVVLNIHNEQQQDGANPKVYEILAAGAYEVCDANPYLEKHFSKMMDLYHSEEEMIAMLEAALNNSQKLTNAVILGNTFEDRMREVVKDYM